MSKEIDGSFHPSVIRKVRHCKSCKAKCDMKEPIVGCESIMVPNPPLKLFEKVFDYSCERRIWFDKTYFPVDFWRAPTEDEFKVLSSERARKEWQKKLRRELKMLQNDALISRRRIRKRS